MQLDPIVEEVRAIREAYARRFEFDLEAILADLKGQEEASGKKLVRFAPRRAKLVEVTPEPSTTG